MKSFLSSLGVVVVALLALAASDATLYLRKYAAMYFAPSATFMGIPIVNLLLAGAFCALVWFMLVKGAGDRIPPLVMLAFGLAGLLFQLFSFSAGIKVNDSLAFLAYPTYPVSMVPPLFVVFGVAGLLTKPRAG